MAPRKNIPLAVVFAFVALFLQPASTQYELTCPFHDDSQQQSIIMDCISSSPETMKIVRGVMASQGAGDASLMQELDDEICSHTIDIARSLSCVLEKTKQCLPLPDGDMKDTLNGLMPDEGRIEKAFDYICENRNKFTPADMQCVQSVQAQLSECMSMEMQKEMKGLNIEDTSTVRGAVCRVPKLVDDCFHIHRGNCSKAFVDTVVEVSHILLPCEVSTLVPFFLGYKVSSQYAVTCPLSDTSQLEAIVMDCFSSSPEAMEIVKIVRSSQGGALSIQEQLEDKLCQNTGDIARSLNCLLEKAKQCLPLPDGDMKDTLNGLMPDEGRMKRAFDYMCENRNKFTLADWHCFQPVQAQFSQCLSTEIQREMQGFNPEDSSTLKSVVCRVPTLTNECFHRHRGNCSNVMVDTLVGTIDKLLPCSKSQSEVHSSKGELEGNGFFFNKFSSLVPDICPFLDETKRLKTIMECVTANPGVSTTVLRLSFSANLGVSAAEVGPNSSNLFPQELIDAMCQQTEDFASVSACLVDKTKPCFPPVIAGIPRQPLIDLLPNDERFKKAFDYFCRNRDKFNPEHLQCLKDQQNEIAPCLDKKVQSALEGVSPNDEDSVKDAVCSAMYEADHCLKINTRNCHDDTVKLVTDIVNIFNPCDGAAQNGVTIFLLVAAALLSLFHTKIF